ncbi:MAG: hypothetical protein A3G23_00465 [Bacteroidetes bacterium RIFCSPLOWO2_12_FULL_37_12]|nr:MAG: hypothetical protein A3G23_00465 [Bacteroidetes bacterium RIFCSPLOWO2_12_FULL_37_12]
MKINKPIRILHLEDNPYDAQIIEREIQKSDFIYEYINVINKSGFLYQLKKFKPDIVLSDHTLKDFNSIEAFEIVKKYSLYIPFILITGTTSEEFAVARIKEGVDDYILKSSILRLPEAIKNSLKKKQEAFENTQNLKKLKQEKEFIKLLLDHSRLLVLVLDRHGVVKIFNKACQRLTGFSSSEIVHKPVWEKLVPVEQTERSKKFFNDEKGYIEKNEYINNWVTKEGNSVLIQWSNSFFFNKKGKIKSMLGVGRDITDMNNLKNENENLSNQLIQAQKMEILGTMTSGLAHDYNNILAALLGNLSLIDPLLTRGSRELKIIKRIETSTTRLAALNQQLLQFTRKSQQEEKALNINSLIEETCNIIIKTVDKRVEIKKQFQPDLPETMGDENQMMQLFMNIIMNGVDAISETFEKNNCGTINIHTARTILENEKQLFGYHGVNLNSELLKVTISDTGTGIPESIQHNIFQPFFTTKSKGKGTGLGLSIADSVIKKHKGAILYDSEKGIGTTFYIYLPIRVNGIGLKRPETQKQVLENNLPQESQRKTLKFLKILIVDDEEDVLEFFGDVLTGLGHYPITTISGNKALEIFRKDFKNIDLVIIDLNLPDMNGAQIWDELKKINPTTKVVIFSGALVQEDINDYLKKGAIAVLLKPLSLEKLKEALKMVGE